MALYRKPNSRWRRTEFWQKAILRFLLGFLMGALFYYMFQQSFSGLFQQMEKNMASWETQNHTFLSGLARSIWNHGKYFGLFWVFTRNKRIYKLYEILFTLYTGFRNGFLLLFFLMERGMRGILLYLASMFPHILLLAPLYLFCFFWMGGNRKKEGNLPIYLSMIAVLFAACVLEVRCNLPIMEKLV